MLIPLVITAGILSALYWSRPRAKFYENVSTVTAGQRVRIIASLGPSNPSRAALEQSIREAGFRDITFISQTQGGTYAFDATSTVSGYPILRDATFSYSVLR